MSLTGKTGKYQDQVRGLPPLPLNHYERIFKVFTEGKSGKQFYFYNLLNKIELPSNIDSSILDTYIVRGKQPFTTVSYNIYGDIHSWWILFLLNKELMNKKFFFSGGEELTYIVPSKRSLLYQQMTRATILNK
mgnify:FL=1